MVGTVLFRLEAVPTCWDNFAFSVAMAAAASGNIALIVCESSPDGRTLLDRPDAGRAEGTLAESTESLLVESEKAG